ncbi:MULTISPECIES: hypothetical protein [unclassified Streptomyces]|uniref:hypothetical protein n=1 Tax=unclassified Streptomyces TaxID=2593676 RepID=UPI0011E69126|nr:hypothetical protein [Streptomyces sp. sk2.1]TXS72073.1 hypothetical protein EAO76_18860 [Streptomyces sp. sk2.1]
MSRTQWCCLMAVVAVVLGLFCGPAATVPGGSGGGASVTAAVPTVARAGHDPDSGPAVVSADERQQVPGCGRGKKRDGNGPSLPGRARAPYDQAPGLAGWGLPAAIGQGPVRPPARIGLRGPEPAAPTPVELSVLRV